jgi:hypothetical protein
VEVLGRRLGGPVARIGPVKNPNFPWIVLDRALLHYLSIVRRAHARRDVLSLADDGAKQGVVGRLQPDVRDRLGKLLAGARGNALYVPDDVRGELVDALETVLESLERDSRGADR